MSTCSPGSKVSVVQVAVIKRQRDKYPKGVELIEKLCNYVHEHRGDDENCVLHKHRKLYKRDVVGNQVISVLNDERARKALEAQQDLSITLSDCVDCKIVVIAVNKVIAKQAVVEICRG